jgi:glycosyltransferase involved in cell wall biosynthesis
VNPNALDRPKVTVIIPCYNREKYIRETIDSALAQTYPNTEIVAVDDGSTDSTREVLESYGHRIRVLEHPGGVNKGQSAAINLGLQSTQSEYVAILDSDDLFVPEKVERQAEYLEQHPEVGLVYSNGWAMSENGKRLYKFYGNGHVEKSKPERVLLGCYFLLPNNALVRRSVFNLVGGFDESLRSGQDHDMAIRLAEVTTIGYFNENLFFYRRHGDSISFRKTKLRWENGFKILEKAANRYPYPRRVLRHRAAVLNFRLAQCLLEEGKFLKAFWFFAKAGILHPFRAMRVLMRGERFTSPH